MRTARQRYMDRAGDEFDAVLSRCESPIEQLFAGELLAVGWGRLSREEECYARTTAEDFGLRYRPDHALSRSVFFVMLQAEFQDSPYRLDFAFVVAWTDKGGRTNGVRIAVELDGHDFHERTKEQARRDKERDRWLTKHGWRVLRFTGSEVFRAPHRCAGEVESILDALFDEGTRKDLA